MEKAGNTMWNDIVKANCARASTTASQPSNIADHPSLLPARAYHAGCNDSMAFDRGGSAIGAEQPCDGALDLLVLAFAGVLEHDLAVPVDDVLRRPILVAVRVPGL